MEIKALEKLSIIDYPNRLSCVIFLQGCNLRCGFCHNPELVLSNELQNISEEKILEFLAKRKKYLDGVCITGGEPLLSLDVEFLKKIKQLGYLIKIDTNGCFPEKLKELIDLKLIDYIAMDIKSSKEKYSEVAGKEVDFDKIEQSIKIISEFPEYEFRTTILLDTHTKEYFEKMMKWIYEITDRKLKRFCLQGFKNQGKVIDENFKDKKDTSENYILELKEIAEKYCDKVIVRV